MSINNTISLVNIEDEYDHHGALLYTIVILFFYSFSLFYSLILCIDPSDHYHEKKWSVCQTCHSIQADILNVLSDQSLRQKYWQIYYGDDLHKHHSDKFRSAELKRLSNVSQQMKKLSNEQLKQSSQHEELDELNRIAMFHTPQTSPDPSASPFLFRFRRARSTSVPSVSYSDCFIHHSYDPLSQTPLCKPSPRGNFRKH